jgi:hypothetical protein
MEQKNLGGMIKSDLVDAFTQQTDERGYKKKRAIAAAINLWLSLPSDIQSHLFNKESPAEAYSILLGKVLEQLTNLDGKLKEKYTEQSSPQKKVMEFRTSIKKFLQMKAKEYKVIFKYLSPDEQSLLNQLRDKLGPEGQNNEKENLA